MEIPTITNPVVSRIHLIGGEKGGVGKSMVSRLLAQYFIDHQIPFVGFDTDRSHGSLMRFYSDYAAPAMVDRFEALDQIVECAVEEPGRPALPVDAQAADGELTLTVAEGRKMVDAARKHKRIVQTGSQQRSDARFRLACPSGGHRRLHCPSPRS